MQTGCNPDVISKFLRDKDIESMEPHDHNVALLFDKISLKSGLNLARLLESQLASVTWVM